MTRTAASLFALALAGFALSGCASHPQDPAPAADETADFEPVSYREVCLLENDAVKSPRLADAVESGLRKGGAEVRRIRSGSGPMVCPFVITYDVPSDSGLVNVIRFQTFEHGIPRVDAAGTAPEGRALTVQAVEAYAAELLARIAHRGGAENEAPEGGSSK